MEQSRNTERQAIRQEIRPQRTTAKGFVLSCAGIMLRLAVCQLICVLLAKLLEAPALNALVLLYAAALLLSLLKKKTAGCVYELAEDKLILSRTMGDRRTRALEIPLEAILAVRTAAAGERLRVSYKRVTDARVRGKSLRMRTAYAAALVSAGLARMIAGGREAQEDGVAVAFTEGSGVHAGVFAPDPGFSAALQEAVGERWGWDDRMARPHVQALWGRALERAFPGLYPNVVPLVTAEESAWAKEQHAAAKARRNAIIARWKEKQPAKSAKNTKTKKPAAEKPEQAASEEKP